MSKSAMKRTPMTDAKKAKTAKHTDRSRSSILSLFPEEATDIREKTAGILNAAGYPDYALALAGFAGVYALPLKGRFIAAADWENLYVRSDLTDDELSLAVRHEILHLLLKHDRRRKRRRDLTLWKRAAHFEVSHYDSVHDEKVRAASEIFRDGCSVMNHPSLRNLIAEEIYDRLESHQREKRYLQWKEKIRKKSPAQPRVRKNAAKDPLLSEVQKRLKSVQSRKRLCNALIKSVRKNFHRLSAKEQSRVIRSGSVPGLSAGLKTDGGQTELCYNAVSSAFEMPKEGIARLKHSLRTFFIRQERIGKIRSYRYPSKKYQDSGVIMKGRRTQYRKVETLAVYVDMSGSMDRERLERAAVCCETIRKFKRTAVIRKYFDSSVHDEFRPGGGTDYNAVLADAARNRFACIAVITDNAPAVIKDRYEFEAVWLIGVEKPDLRRPSENYAFLKEMDAPKHRNPDGKIKAKYFELDIVSPKASEKDVS